MKEQSTLCRLLQSVTNLLTIYFYYNCSFFLDKYNFRNKRNFMAGHACQDKCPVETNFNNSKISQMLNIWGPTGEFFKKYLANIMHNNLTSTYELYNGQM